MAWVEKLVVGRRDRTKLVDGVLKQIALVRDVVGDLPVSGALWFVEADWPLIGGAFSTRGVNVLWPKRLAKLLTEGGEGAVDVPAVRRTLAARFKPAQMGRPRRWNDCMSEAREELIHLIGELPDEKVSALLATARALDSRAAEGQRRWPPAFFGSIEHAANGRTDKCKPGR